MNKLLATGMLLLFSGFACAAVDPPSERKIVEVKHLRGLRLDRAVSLVNDFMRPGDALSYGDLNTVLLRGTPERIAAGEELLKRFDIPDGANAPALQNYQIRIYMVEAGSDACQNGPVPAEISSAVEQMKKSFQYRSYRLLDTVLVQAGRNGATAEGILPGGTADAPLKTTYFTRIQEITPSEQGKVLNLRNFNFRIRLPMQVGPNTSYIDTSMSSDLTIREGQKLVVGKLSKDTSLSAIFLIITAQPI